MGSLHDEGQMDDHVGFGDQRVDGCPIQDVAVLVRRLRPALRRRVRPAGHPDDPAHGGSSSSAVTAEIPISPGGPVTATVSPIRLSFPKPDRINRGLIEPNG